jgi:hypothetical protein
MHIEPVLLVNGISKVVAAAASMFLAARLGKEKRCMLSSPFYFLASALLVVSLLDFLWSFGLVDISGIDNALVSPAFNMILMAVWFYTALIVSGHRNIYYFIPLVIMSINVLLLFSNMALMCDIITGLALLCVFFYVGFVDHHLVKKIGYAGMAYGLLMIAVSYASHMLGIGHVFAPWFATDLALIAVLWLMSEKGHVCASSEKHARHHIPLVVEVFRFSIFIIGLVVFLMLGTLGVHELGHSMTANAFDCSHETSFGVGFAVTHILCDSSSGSVMIALGGFSLTILISLLMYFMGNDFARRLSFMMLAFSMLIAVDDFTGLGLPYSIVFIIVFAAAMLIGYGISLIVSEYDTEYLSHEAVCTSAACKD